uniref:Uncharacterized protein n=1 Tax=Anguilla anguilla TaxID=7936 RepID=A0A0E9V9P3_ANGAN
MTADQMQAQLSSVRLRALSSLHCFFCFCFNVILRVEPML